MTPPNRSNHHHSDFVPKCSFCSKTELDGVRLVAGTPSVFICNECTELCWDIFYGEQKPMPEKKLKPVAPLSERLERYMREKEKKD